MSEDDFERFAYLAFLDDFTAYPNKLSGKALESLLDASNAIVGLCKSTAGQRSKGE